MSRVPTTKILWATFGLITVSTITQWVLTTRQQPNTKLLHHISLTLSTLTLVTYYFMLTDINVTGSSIWIRDLHWILTFPLVFVELGLISGVSIQDLVIMALNAIGMCVTGFLGTIQRSNRLRWPLVLMAWIFWLSLAREILTSGRRSAARNSPRVARFFNFLAGYIVVLGSFYPIIWSIPVDPFLEIALFAVLDMLTRPIFATWVLVGVSIIPESNVVGANRYIEARIWNSIGGNLDEQPPEQSPEA
ncbi:hypothetical protein PCASD_10443 [Puccinia coronata f. sp. avenae]|uniref:Opsin n=1 Tax=Puccinia coronata f. sp. avenae TaxID=200324 RepID=A0A2N5UEP5_9BASI|nr:hypothetical protein PCASD_10443 [Puccinia coronata f. sp. avenae]